VQKKKQPKQQPHHFTQKVLHWPYCSGCGLIKLKNDTTEKAAQQPCSSED